MTKQETLVSEEDIYCSRKVTQDTEWEKKRVLIEIENLREG